MKFLPSQFAYLLSEKSSRRNLRALFQYVVFLTVTVAVLSVLFHIIMVYEGQQHSWLTGFYWTLTVMSTLGFGDITFHSDLGRAFSLVVLLAGIILLLIVLPFAFIRFFYAPWLEAQIKVKAPREAPAGLRDHVIICRYDAVARSFIERLTLLGIPYLVIEPDPVRAAHLMAENVQVVTGEWDNRATYEASHAADARLILANLDDAANTNITLTVREMSETVPITALIENPYSEDILELSGANKVIIVKEALGQLLASRVDADAIHTHEVGRYQDLTVAEFPVHGTKLAGQKIRDAQLREKVGVTVVAYWERGILLPAQPNAVLSNYSVVVVVGTADSVASLDVQFPAETTSSGAIVVLGGGRVGCATARALKDAGISVHQVDKNPEMRESMAKIADRAIIGDAAELQILLDAGIKEAPSVVLTTNSDAINIYLAIYCRRLNPDLRIVSRITEDRNLEAIHRAGADFVLSDTALVVKQLVAQIQGRGLFVLGEEVDFFFLRLPEQLADQTLAESCIGSSTGLNVVAIRHGENVVTLPGPDEVLPQGCEVVAVGTREQREGFFKAFQNQHSTKHSKRLSLPAPDAVTKNTPIE